MGEAMDWVYPTPIVGMIYVPTAAGSRAKPRKVTFIGPVPGNPSLADWDVVGWMQPGINRGNHLFSHGGIHWESWVHPQSWRNWCRTHRAVAVMQPPASAA